MEKESISFGRREFIIGAAAVIGGAAAITGCSSATGVAEASAGPIAEAAPVSPFVAVDDFVPPAPADDAALAAVGMTEGDTRATPIEDNLVLLPTPSGMLEGQVAIVTGASSGFGREIARAYAREGAKVVAAARRTERLVALAEESAKYPGEIAAFTCDVTDRGQLKQMIDFAVDTYGKLDILVNNAGGIGSLGSVGFISEGQWDYMVELNLTAPVLGMKFAIPHMLENGYGRIINISSIAGLKGGVGGIEYTTTKHGLIGATKNTAYMYAQDNITCNVICPGGFDTEVSTSIYMGDEEGMARLGENGGIQRQGKTEEIAAMAVYLVSPGAVGLNADSVWANGGGWGAA